MKKVYFSLVALFVMNSIFGQVPTDGLVAHYPFSGDANDASGNGLNGIVNGAILTNDRFGNTNEAYLFNGNDNITVVNFPMPAKEITISLWAKTDTIKKQMVFKQLSDDTNRVAASIHYQSSGETYGDSINTYWDYNNAAGGRIYDTVKTAKIDVWEHYVFIVSNKEKHMKVFLNNEEVISDTVVASLQDSVFTLAIGGSDYHIEGGLFYRGSIDDFRVYNRELSNNEIQELFNEVDVTGIKNHEESFSYNVYPNPTTGKINIESKSTDSFKVKIISIAGSTIFESELCKESYIVDLTPESVSGLFLLQIIDKDNNLIKSKKLVIH
jgi:hypothetical protein